MIATGVRVERIKAFAFLLSGATAGFSGALMAARLGSGSPTLANEFLLPAIAAIILGGTALTGGVGGVWRTFVGALIIAVVRIGMTFLGVSVFAQQIVFGVALVAAVGGDHRPLEDPDRQMTRGRRASARRPLLDPSRPPRKAIRGTGSGRSTCPSSP